MALLKYWKCVAWTIPRWVGHQKPFIPPSLEDQQWNQCYRLNSSRKMDYQRAIASGSYLEIWIWILQRFESDNFESSGSAPTDQPMGKSFSYEGFLTENVASDIPRRFLASWRAKKPKIMWEILSPSTQMNKVGIWSIASVWCSKGRENLGNERNDRMVRGSHSVLRILRLKHCKVI